LVLPRQCQASSQPVLMVQIQGQKTLILDPALAGPLGLVTEVALLKVKLGLFTLRLTSALSLTGQNQAVDKMFWLESGPLNIGTRNVVWLCRPRLHLMRIIAGESMRSHITRGCRSSWGRANTAPPVEAIAQRTRSVHTPTCSPGYRAVPENPGGRGRSGGSQRAGGRAVPNLLQVAELTRVSTSSSSFLSKRICFRSKWTM
jgi:hypothetical protein